MNLAHSGRTATTHAMSAHYLIKRIQADRHPTRPCMAATQWLMESWYVDTFSINRINISNMPVQSYLPGQRLCEGSLFSPMIHRQLTFSF